MNIVKSTVRIPIQDQYWAPNNESAPRVELMIRAYIIMIATMVGL